MSVGTLFLKRSDIVGLLSLGECVPAMEQAFALHHQGRALTPDIMHVEADGGEFHIKGGGLRLWRTYFALKANGGFFSNRALGLPSIRGLILLFDGANGSPLAVMDSRDITVLRTGATTAVAAKHLARPDSRVATICGCGTQGRVQLESVLHVFPQIERVFVWSHDAGRASEFAAAESVRLGVRIEARSDLPASARASDIIVTCTPARSFFLRSEDVRPGTFIAAVGADSPEKQELEPTLVAGSRLIVDILEQCARVGELHHAIEAKLMDRSRVYAELGAVVAGAATGGPRSDVVTVFDSTGSAIQDTAAAALVYEKAVAHGVGTRFDLQQ